MLSGEFSHLIRAWKYLDNGWPWMGPLKRGSKMLVSQILYLFVPKSIRKYSLYSSRNVRYLTAQCQKKLDGLLSYTLHSANTDWKGEKNVRYIHQIVSYIEYISCFHTLLLCLGKKITWTQIILYDKIRNITLHYILSHPKKILNTVRPKSQRFMKTIKRPYLTSISSNIAIMSHGCKRKSCLSWVLRLHFS